MSFDFPSSPTVNQIFTGSNGAQYIWNGTTWNQVSGNPATLTAQARNRIVNGAMQINQEVPGPVASGYPVDQFLISGNIATINASWQPTFGPEGLAALATTLTTAKPSLAAGDFWQLLQPLEGKRVADFRFGTANAKQVVARFSAVCSQAGTYTFKLANGASNRVFLAPFTLVANTWKEITVVIPGDPTGTWPTDATAGMYYGWGLAAGSTYNAGVAGWQGANAVQMAGHTNLAAPANANFFVTNVGLYLDDQNTGVPPPWVMPDEAQELAACQRYWHRTSLYWNGYATTGVSFAAVMPQPVPTRIVPALTGVSGGATGFANTIGALDAPLTPTIYREVRACNATSTSGTFYSTVTASARM